MQRESHTSTQIGMLITPRNRSLFDTGALPDVTREPPVRTRQLVRFGRPLAPGQNTPRYAEPQPPPVEHKRSTAEVSKKRKIRGFLAFLPNF
jgi:hypothetical protein